MTLNEYMKKLAKIHDDMRKTVDEKEINELLVEENNLIEKMLKEHYWYIRPQERENR